MTERFVEEFTSLPDEAQRQVLDFVAFLQQRYKSTQAVPTSRVVALEKESFIGMWRNRQDLEDSTAWIRNTREAQWGADELSHPASITGTPPASLRYQSGRQLPLELPLPRRRWGC